MAGYVHVKAKKENVIPAVLSMRKASAKMELFSMRIVVFITLVCAAAFFLTFDSFLKSYRNAQLVKIRSGVDGKREANFKLTEYETKYMRLMSSQSLMKRAEELKMGVATKEKVIVLK